MRAVAAAAEVVTAVAAVATKPDRPQAAHAVRASQSRRQKIRPREEADYVPCFPRDLGETRKAGEGTRTLDIQLGKLALYQLSYAREPPAVYHIVPAFKRTGQAPAA